MGESIYNILRVRQRTVLCFLDLVLVKNRKALIFRKGIVERKEKPLNLIEYNLLHRTLSNQPYSLSRHLESFLILLTFHFYHFPGVRKTEDSFGLGGASLLFHMLIYLLICTAFF